MPFENDNENFEKLFLFGSEWRDEYWIELCDFAQQESGGTVWGSRDKNIQVFSAFATGDLKPDEATPEDTDALLYSSGNSNILENVSPSSSTKQMVDDGSIRRLLDSPSPCLEEEEEDDGKTTNKGPDSDPGSKMISKELFSAWIQQGEDGANNSANFSDDDMVMEHKPPPKQTDLSYLYQIKIAIPNKVRVHLPPRKHDCWQMKKKPWKMKLMLSVVDKK